MTSAGFELRKGLAAVMARAALGVVLASAFLCATGISGAHAEQKSGALGQIVPRGGIVTVTGVPGATVLTVSVRPGDTVKTGDILMTLDGDSIDMEQELATVGLQDVKKQVESQLATQDLTIELAKQRQQEAARELESYRTLGTRSTSANETARLVSAESQARLALQIEVTKRQAMKIEADKALQAAQRRLSLAIAARNVRAPTDGTVLKIERRPGQRLDGGSAIQLGDLRTMYVTCQVYEGDLLDLKPGMKASIKNAVLTKPIGGTVEEIGRVVDSRARLGEVRIKLDSAEPANRLVGMEVEVVIAR